jgi:hypothetical protein
MIDMLPRMDAVSVDQPVQVRVDPLRRKGEEGRTSTQVFVSPPPPSTSARCKPRRLQTSCRYNCTCSHLRWFPSLVGPGSLPLRTTSLCQTQQQAVCTCSL